MTNPLFQDDEMTLRQIDPNWSHEELLNQEGIFFLKDICKVLGLDTIKVKRRARGYKNAYAILGARKVWNHWIIRMKTFAPYYRKHLIPKTRKVDPEWDGNTLLKQKGVFLLTDISKKLPFSTHQLRYQAKRNPNSRKEYGIWKDKELKVFLVNMEPFFKMGYQALGTRPGKLTCKYLNT